MKNIILIISILLYGCAPHYQYTAIDDSDPVITFYDQFNQDKITKSGFFVATRKPSPVAKCEDIIRVGTNVTSIRVPAGQIVSITAHYVVPGAPVGFLATCSPPGREFLAEPYGTYSVDVAHVKDTKLTGRCNLSVIDKKAGKEMTLDEAILFRCESKNKGN